MGENCVWWDGITCELNDFEGRGDEKAHFDGCGGFDVDLMRWRWKTFRFRKMGGSHVI